MLKYEELTDRLDTLEAESAIRRLVAAYERARDVRQDGGEVARLFTLDGIWEAVGPTARQLGRHEDREAIARRTDWSVTFMPFSAKVLGNEAIAVDGDTAVGQWGFL